MIEPGYEHENTGWAEIRRMAGRSKMIIAGLVILGSFTVLAFIHPVLTATVWADRPDIYRPVTGHDTSISHPSGPSVAHPLGTDPLGRDVLSLMTYGLRPSFIVAVASAIGAATVGLIAGTSAAFFRGRYDRVMTHVSDAFMLLPPPLVFLLASKRGLMGPLELGLLYGILFGLGPAAIVVRARALAVMEKPFIDAARSAGGSSRWIITHHVVPHVIPHLAVVVLAGVVGALVTQGFVEYLGIGKYRYGLGNLMYNALVYQGALGTSVPWSSFLAGSLGISLLASSFYMISAGLRAVADPRSRRRV
ncbi:MAG: ABC transporter permease subunit [Acidimicrobiia bacterium]